MGPGGRLFTPRLLAKSYNHRPRFYFQAIPASKTYKSSDMKKLLIVLFSLGLAFGAFAQKGHYHRGGYHVVRPRVIVGVGTGFYSPFYSPFYRPYSPFYSPYGSFYNSKPSRLDLEIQDIRLDYEDRINSVKMDDGLSRKEKRQRIKNLKYDRDKAIIDAKKDYYYKREQDQS